MKEGIELTYIYSACIITKTKDLSILHDPWFTEGIYDGSWFHFPKTENPITIIGDVDYIYISHIHPDHYDPIFIRKYFNYYGEKPILIANHKKNHLQNKMLLDGFKPNIVTDTLKFKNTTVDIVPHETGSASDIDSAFIMKYKSDRIHCLVNGNDVVYDSHLKEIIKNMAGDIDIYLGSYTAAGPYPQTYFDLNDPKIRIEAEKIREKCLAIYESDINFFNAKINIPFAGKYMLGGRATELNQFLPVIDPIIVQRVDRNAVILSDAGGKINTFDFIPSKIRENEYTKEEILQRCKELSNKKMNYEKLFSENEIHQLPIKRLIRQAAKNAISKSEVLNDYFFAIQLPDNNFAVINASKNSSEEVLFTSDISNITPRSEIYIDPRYLFGLLTHIYHWNNAEVGSNYRTRRFPNIFNRSVQNFLNFLTV